MAKLEVSIDSAAVANAINATVAQVIPMLRQQVQALSVAAHAFVINKAQEELTGYKLDAYLGDDNKNVRWTRVGDSMWVVELDSSAAWIEEGRPAMFMDWLLNSPKAKVNKRGEKYMSIPFENANLKGSGKKGKSDRNPALAAMIRNHLKANKIPVQKIEKDANGEAKIGVLHRISPPPPGPQSQFPTLFSEPRTQAMADLTGLPAHGGIPLLQDTLIVQRKNAKGKVVREAVTFRTITERHRQEGRWVYPEVQPLDAMGAAYRWSQEQVEGIVKSIQDELSRAGA